MFKTTLATKLFPIFLFFLITEGILRKSLPGEPNSVLLIKDGILLIQSLLLITHILISSSYRQFLSSFSYISSLRFAIIAFSIAGTLSLFSIISGSVKSDSYFLGFREYFFYLPLVIISYEYFSQPQQLWKVIHIAIILSIFINIAGVLQSSALIDSALLRPISQHHDVHSSEFGDFSFQSSIFDVPERFAAFNLFIVIVCISFLTQFPTKLSPVFLVTAFIFAWLGLFLCGRRVFFVVGSFMTIYMLIIFGKHKALILSLILTFIPVFIFILQILSPVLFNVFLVSTFWEIPFYLKWFVTDVQRALYIAPSPFYGFLGIVSSGNTSVNEGYMLFYGVIEATWSKVILSLGVVNAVIIAISQTNILIELGQKCRVNQNQFTTLGLFYLLSITLINIKGGEYLVWSPLTMIVIGMACTSIVPPYFLHDVSKAEYRLPKVTSKVYPKLQIIH